MGLFCCCMQDTKGKACLICVAYKWAKQLHATFFMWMSHLFITLSLPLPVCDFEICVAFWVPLISSVISELERESFVPENHALMY